jgi:hypothetical protein
VHLLSLNKLTLVDNLFERYALSKRLAGFPRWPFAACEYCVGLFGFETELNQQNFI